MTTDAELSSPELAHVARRVGGGYGDGTPRDGDGAPADRPGADTEPSAPRAPIAPRVASALLLLTLLTCLGAVGWTVVRVFTDAWVGPAHLSPDNDQVLSMRLRMNQQLAEMARVDAEVARIDEELAALDTAEQRLGSLRRNAVEALTWSGESEERLARTLASSVRRLEEQVVMAATLRDRQAELVAEIESAAEAGLATTGAVERERTALMRSEMSLGGTRRQLEETRVKAVEARQRADAMRRGASAMPLQVASPEHGELPEVVAREEQEVRVELELVRLGAERRGLQAMRRAAVEGLERSRALLEEIKARPLFRAMEAQTDVAFVPYAHLDKVVEGDAVVRCVWGVFWCTEVGEISEILPGEVATQDPWGELARGRYAILELADATAIQEQTLRVRAR